MKYKDKRMKMMTEILNGIKVGRFFHTAMNKMLIIVLKRKLDIFALITQWQIPEPDIVFTSEN